jgi:hypothetical protein
MRSALRVPMSLIAVTPKMVATVMVRTTMNIVMAVILVLIDFMTQTFLANAPVQYSLCQDDAKADTRPLLRIVAGSASLSKHSPSWQKPWPKKFTPVI